MDTTVDAAPQVPTVRHQMRFEGSGGEYFKIWIVNLALSIVTLGIFSAWAKVRSKRYFYGNTYIGEHSFDYHANPLRILLGRLVALCLLLGYTATIHFMPAATFVWYLVFAVAGPWLINASLRFNARNTSYRNVRFNFEGNYGEAFVTYVLLPIVAVITLLTTYPLARRARDHYSINNRTFGNKYFQAQIPGWPMYKIYLLALLISMGLLMLGIVLVTSLVTVTGIDFKSIDPKLPGTAMKFLLAFGSMYALVFLTMTTFVGTKVFNLALNHTMLADRYRFEATLSSLHMIWLLASNLVLTLVTLGLFYPWAAVRLARYRCQQIAITGPADMDGFMSEVMTGQGAVGEEIASFFDVDIGL